MIMSQPWTSAVILLGVLRTVNVQFAMPMGVYSYQPPPPVLIFMMAPPPPPPPVAVPVPMFMLPVLVAKNVTTTTAAPPDDASSETPEPRDVILLHNKIKPPSKCPCPPCPPCARRAPPVKLP